MTLSTRVGRRALAVATDYSLPVQVYCAPGSGLPGDDSIPRFLTVTAAEARQLLADGTALHPDDVSVTWNRCEAGSMEDTEDCNAPATVAAAYVEPWRRADADPACPPADRIIPLRLCCACACAAEEYPDPWLRIGAARGAWGMP